MDCIKMEKLYLESPSESASGRVSPSILSKSSKHPLFYLMVDALLTHVREITYSDTCCFWRCLLSLWQWRSLGRIHQKVSVTVFTWRVVLCFGTRIHGHWQDFDLNYVTSNGTFDVSFLRYLLTENSKSCVTYWSIWSLWRFCICAEHRCFSNNFAYALEMMSSSETMIQDFQLWFSFSTRITWSLCICLTSFFSLRLTRRRTRYRRLLSTFSS